MGAQNPFLPAHQLTHLWPVLCFTPIWMHRAESLFPTGLVKRNNMQISKQAMILQSRKQARKKAGFIGWERGRLMRWWRIKKGLKVTIPGRWEPKREQESRGEMRCVSLFSAWKDTDIVCYVTKGDKRLEEDRSAIAWKVEWILPI